MWITREVFAYYDQPCQRSFVHIWYNAHICAAHFDNNIVQLDWIGSCFVYKLLDEDFSFISVFFQIFVVLWWCWIKTTRYYCYLLCVCVIAGEREREWIKIAFISQAKCEIPRSHMHCFIVSVELFHHAENFEMRASNMQINGIWAEIKITISGTKNVAQIEACVNARRYHIYTL